MQKNFPPSFLWGTATSSYQYEGDNYNCDWFLWEKNNNLERCGKACNHYNLFKEDFKLAHGLNINSLRFSIEWSRIFPEREVFANDQLQHYVNVLDCLLSYNLKPIVTLHHFTNPLWFTQEGGWLKKNNVDLFLKYLKLVVEELKDKVDIWLIFNEPLVYIYNSYVRGIWPPGIKSFRQAFKVYRNIVSAYINGYQEIKRIYGQNSSKVKVSLAKHIRDFTPLPDNKLWLNSFSAYLRNKLFNYYMLEYLAKKKCLDFIGVNYYCKEYVRFQGLLGEDVTYNNSNCRNNYLGWHISADSFFNILLKLKKFNLPILITENGTAELNDKAYEDYLVSHLKSVEKALANGVNIIGYQYWSLLDNFEWDRGFGCRFGLFKVDYNNFARIPREFSHTYSKIIKENI